MYPTNCNVGGATFNPYYPTALPTPMQQSMSYTKPTLIGKVVNRSEDVTPNDIPMDGSYGVFPLQDRSKLYLKKWNADGTITTETYVKEVIDIPKEPINDPLADEIAMLRQQLDRIEKSLKPKTSNKKEVAVNE